MEELMYIVTPTGISRYRNEGSVIVDETLSRAFLESARIPIRNAFKVDGLPVKLSAMTRQLEASVSLRSLHLTSRFSVSPEGEVMLRFSDSGALGNFNWTPPEGMVLLLVVTMDHSGFDWAYGLSNSWLAAFDSELKTYRLPLSNTFADGKLCLGRQAIAPGDVQSVVTQVHHLLNTAPYNSDLPETNPRTTTHCLFRWKPNATSGFDQLPLPEGVTWQSCCYPISNDIITKSMMEI